MMTDNYMRKISFSQCIDNFFYGLRISKEIWPKVLLVSIVAGMLSFLASSLLGLIFSVVGLQDIIKGLTSQVLSGLFGLSIMNATCLYMFHDRELTWDSAISILWNSDFLLKALGLMALSLIICVLFYLAALIVSTLCGVIAMAVFNSPAAVIPVIVIAMIPAAFLFVAISVGFGLTVYLIAPGGKDAPVIESLQRGLKASFSNLSITWSSIVISLGLVLLLGVAMLPLIALFRTSLVLSAVYIILLILVMIPFFYSLHCFTCKNAHYIFTDPLTDDRKDNDVNEPYANNRLNSYN